MSKIQQPDPSPPSWQPSCFSCFLSRDFTLSLHHLSATPSYHQQRPQLINPTIDAPSSTRLGLLSLTRTTPIPPSLPCLPRPKHCGRLLLKHFARFPCNIYNTLFRPRSIDETVVRRSTSTPTLLRDSKGFHAHPASGWVAKTKNGIFM